VLSILLTYPIYTLPSKVPALDLLKTKIYIGKTQDNGIIPIMLFKNDQVVKEFNLGEATNKYECTKGAILRSLSTSQSLYYGIAIYGGGQYFRPSSDGSLVLEFDVKVGGAFLIIPIGGHDRVWYRWERIEDIL